MFSKGQAVNAGSTVRSPSSVTGVPGCSFRVAAGSSELECCRSYCAWLSLVVCVPPRVLERETRLSEPSTRSVALFQKAVLSPQSTVPETPLPLSLTVIMGGASVSEACVGTGSWAQCSLPWEAVAGSWGVISRPQSSEHTVLWQMGHGRAAGHGAKGEACGCG